MINNEENTSFTRDEEDNKPINIRELISKYLFHWPIFFVGITVCLIGAFFYLRYTEEVYMVNSTLLIKDEKKGGAAGGSDILADLDVFGSSKLVDNEIEVLRSKTLMQKVVDRLNLMISYNVEGRVISQDIYLGKPVNINVIQMDNALYGKSFVLSFPSKNTYLLEDLEGIKKISGALNQLQRNEFGVYKVDKTANFDKWASKKLNVTISDPQNIVDKCLGNLGIGLSSKQSTVLNLSFQTTVIQRGKDILNTLIQVYNEASLSDKNRTTQSTIDFIDERLKLISGELTEVESDVEGFKSSRGLTDISSDAALFLENVKANDAKLNEVNLQISVINDIQHYVKSNSSEEKLPSTLGINDPVLLGQITQLGDLQLKRDQLLSTTQSSNPLVESLTKQIETTRLGIKTNIENIASSLNNTKKELEGNNSGYQSSIKKIPGQERQLISIKRQQSIKESLYLYLLQKKEEAALSYASTVADSRVLDLAYSSKAPIKPKKQVTYLIALLFGILVPVGYIHGKELMNNKIESSSDIAKLTLTPILGEIFFDQGSEPIVVNANSRKAIAEQFRSIRTNMQFLHGKQVPGQGKVTLLTSSMSGEGKSFVASNIATALAISGRKTILLELDLRKPKVSKYLDLTNKVGLSNYLIGKAEIKDIIQPSGINPNLFVIGSGPIPPNPSELLIQDEIESLVEYLKMNFDEVFIDTPPIGIVTDAQILARLADATLYLVRQNITLRDQVKSMDELYRNKKFPKLNVILNGIKLGGSHGYGYGYGYGYYSDDSEDQKTSLKVIFKDFFKRF
ncbi:tyrosine-protein kinase [Pedobacter foliorum]|uniref:GumC family protein n=1 Tax=Pedobacter foliorum TaxID=2739058 RepID=UPI001563FBC9|nr:tyrosine-protein kinase [Pedobacter foliorum]NRF39184.1 polysaccharide biosynthesis tyrosine autokinase [Pedobacter foliorum]